jgi:hypothetical protein
MQFSLDIFKKYNISYSWETILIGRALKLIEPLAIEQFAVEYLLKNPECKNLSIIELAFGASANEIDSLLEKVSKTLNIHITIQTDIWNLERIKWRYCILKEFDAAIQNNEALLIEIEGVYAFFGYPDDMAELIYYMPPKDLNLYDPSKHTYEENCQRLINNFHAFLEKEKINILNKYIDPSSFSNVDPQ